MIDVENQEQHTEEAAHETESCLTTFKNRATNTYSLFTFACYLGSIPATYLVYDSIGVLPPGRQSEIVLTLTAGNIAWWSLTNLTPISTLYFIFLDKLSCSLKELCCTTNCLALLLAGCAFLSPTVISAPVGNLVLKFVDFLFNTTLSQLTTAEAFAAGFAIESTGGIMALFAALFAYPVCLKALGACKKNDTLNSQDQATIRQNLLSGRNGNDSPLVNAVRNNEEGYTPPISNPMLRDPISF